MKGTDGHQMGWGDLLRTCAVAIAILMLSTMLVSIPSADAAPPPETGNRILVLHDSVVNSARDPIINAFPNRQVEFVGIGGLRVAGAIELLEQHPELVTSDVIVELGTNYANNSRVFRRDLDKLMKLLADANHVLWLQPSRFRPAISAPRKIIRKAAHRYSNLQVVDWGAETARNRHYTRADGIHLEGSGPQALADFMANHLTGKVAWNRIPEGKLARLKVNQADIRAGERAPRVQVKGWAYDPDLQSNSWVRFTIDGKSVRPSQPTHISKPGLADRLEHPNDRVGFDRIIRLKRGTHRLCIEVNNFDGMKPVQLSCRKVVV